MFIFEPKPVRAEKVISKGMIQPLHRREMEGHEMRKSGRGDSARARQPCLFTDTLLLSKADFSINMVTHSRTGVLAERYIKLIVSTLDSDWIRCIQSCWKMTINTHTNECTHSVLMHCDDWQPQTRNYGSWQKIFDYFTFLSLIITDLIVLCHA